MLAQQVSFRTVPLPTEPPIAHSLIWLTFYYQVRGVLYVF